MHAKDAIRSALDMSDLIVGSYIGDLEDADLLVRPVPGMNHIAWQLGHLILTERQSIELIQPGSCPPLPEGFEDNHTADKVGVDDPSRYLGRARYQELWSAQRAATRQVLDACSETDLDRADPAFPSFAPTVGNLLHMAGIHALMHAGQFVAVRRALQKPITI